MKKYTILLVVLIIAFLGVVGLVIKAALRTEQSIKETTKTAESETTTQTTTEAPKEVMLVAVGDVLAHTPVLAAAKREDGSYSFESLFTVMKEDFQTADIAVVNQETILGGTEGGFPYDGYPNFNTPDSMGDAIIEAGFDVVLQASNHSRDAGVSGILHCIEYWKNRSAETMMLGLNETSEERDTVRIFQKNDITFAMLNYTYGLNGYSLPADQPYLVNIMDENSMEKVRLDIEKASQMADFVIVFPHWGVEDRVGNPTEDQQKWSMLMTQAGADLIIGTHPHVIETIEWIEAENGNRSLCYYSIGNYTSNQQELPEVLGGMAKVLIVKEDGVTRIDEGRTGVVPIVTHNDKTGGSAVIQTYHLKDYTEDMAAVHDIYVRFDRNFSRAALQELADRVFGEWVLE